jgi:hypothetical protein
MEREGERGREREREGERGRERERERGGERDNFLTILLYLIELIMQSKFNDKWC